MGNDLARNQQAPDQRLTRGIADSIERMEWITAIAVSAVSLLLFIVRATHAGSHFRDEADAVQSAQLPLSEMFHAVQFSSFPILFPLILRAYTGLFGATDASLRCFGFAVGILLIAVTWLLIRKLIGKALLFLPVMIGLSTNFLIAGMESRGYGLGSLMILLAFVCNVRLLFNPTVPTLVSVFVADLASVQCLFWNGPLVLAFTLAAIGVFLLRREVKWIFPLATILLLCGLSQLFYLWLFHSTLVSWEKVVEVPVSFRLVWEVFFVAWGDVSASVSIIWLSVILVAIIVALWRLTTIRNSYRTHQRDSLLFGALLIPFSIIASCVLARLIGLAPEQRFFLALTVLVAATADLIWATFPLWLRAARVGLTILAMATLPFWFWGYIIYAESNAETVAKMLEQNAEPVDLVVVSPWTYGISFNWYYHGRARWISVPQIDDHRIHRVDLLLTKMESVSPLADLKDEITMTLKSGNRVWFAGQAELPPPGEGPPQLSPAPDPKFGWDGFVYRKAWSQEITLFLSQHVTRSELVDLQMAGLVSARENMPLYLLEGWKD